MRILTLVGHTKIYPCPSLGEKEELAPRASGSMTLSRMSKGVEDDSVTEGCGDDLVTEGCKDSW